MKRLAFAVVLMVGLVVGASSAAAVDIIQDNWSIGNSIGSGEYGQSFKAVTPDIESIGFYYADWNVTQRSAEITLVLREGEGMDGTTLASQTRDLAGLTGWADFDFSDHMLLSGHQYTFEIITSSGRGAVYRQTGNPYPDGTGYLDGQPISNDSDLRFRVLGQPLCSVVEIADGEIEIQCPSGEVLTVDDFSCGVTDNGDGTSTIDCGDGSTVTIADGADGVDGTSCTVEDMGNGTAEISCEDGTSVLVSDGQDGSSCTVEDNGDGTSTLSCEDGTSVTVSDGVDGVDGSSCSVAESGEGIYTIVCEDGTTATVADGTNCSVSADGAGTATVSCDDGSSATVSDGSDCSVEDNGDGTVTIFCTDGESATVSDGQDGDSCTIEDHGDDTATITCTDGTSFTVASGEDGEDGEDGGCSSTSGGPGSLIGLLMVLGAVVMLRRRRT